MTNTVGAISASGPAAAIKGAVQPGSENPRTAAALQARISHYQRQLADCLDCPSAKTPAGKREIEELSHQISDARLRIEALQASSSATTVGSSTGLPPQRSAYSTVGSLIDVFG